MRTIIIPMLLASLYISYIHTTDQAVIPSLYTLAIPMVVKSNTPWDRCLIPAKMRQDIALYIWKNNYEREALESYIQYHDPEGHADAYNSYLMRTLLHQDEKLLACAYRSLVQRWVIDYSTLQILIPIAFCVPWAAVSMYIESACSTGWSLCAFCTGNACSLCAIKKVEQLTHPERVMYYYSKTWRNQVQRARAVLYNDAPRPVHMQLDIKKKAD